MNMVNVAESSLDYNRINKTDLDYARIVKLNDRTIYTHERSNNSADNPNSACEVYFTHKFDINKDDAAVISVLNAFLSEPTFNTLRTQEQLGYIVRSSLAS